MEAGHTRSASSTPIANEHGPESGAAVKKRRITRACDRCHRSGIKCATGSTIGICAPCAVYNLECTYDRPIKRRGPPPKNHDVQERETYVPHPAPIPPIVDDWAYREVAPHNVIQELISFYSSAIYPIQPYYHLPTLLRRIHAKEYHRSRPFFVDLMSLCALTSARIRDGASSPTHPITSGMVSTPSEVFDQAAQEAFPADLTRAAEFEYKRVKSNMALLRIQYGDTKGLYRHLGDYCTLCAIDGFHQESRWPAGLSQVDLQERRRLFWACYQLDIYASCTWGATARHRESETTVLYPAEVLSDDDITPTSVILFPNPADPAADGVSWYRGWNFVCDLYRILEHAIEKVRMRRIRIDMGQGEDGQGGPVSALFERGGGPTQAEILELVGRMYGDLPEVLRVAAPLGEDEDRNRLGFQATNIIITLQTLKMVVAGSGENNISQRCAIAGDLLDAISNVPTAYIYSCSAPVLHHLAGIGHLLGSVIQRPQSLSQWTYLQVRNCLLSMADMLSGLESVLSRTAGIAEKLRTHIERIDRFMAEAARERRGRGVEHGLVREEGRYTLSKSRGNGDVGSTTLNVESLPSSVPTLHQTIRSDQPGNSADSVITDLNPDFDLSNIDFNAFSIPPTSHLPVGDHSSLIDPFLLPPLMPSADTSLPPTQSAPNLDDNGQAPTGDLFADWPFILGNAFEFLGNLGEGDGTGLDK